MSTMPMAPTIRQPLRQPLPPDCAGAGAQPTGAPPGAPGAPGAQPPCGGGAPQAPGGCCCGPGCWGGCCGALPQPGCCWEGAAAQVAGAGGWGCGTACGGAPHVPGAAGAAGAAPAPARAWLARVRRAPPGRPPRRATAPPALRVSARVWLARVRRAPRAPARAWSARVPSVRPPRRATGSLQAPAAWARVRLVHPAAAREQAAPSRARRPGLASRSTSIVPLAVAAGCVHCPASRTVAHRWSARNPRWGASRPSVGRRRSVPDADPGRDLVYNSRPRLGSSAAEQATHNRPVGSSILPPATTFPRRSPWFARAWEAVPPPPPGARGGRRMGYGAGVRSAAHVAGAGRGSDGPGTRARRDGGGT